MDAPGYNYTRPRGPVAAMFSSPGPCYALPSLTGYSEHTYVNSAHRREPSFTLGTKHFAPNLGFGPGPARYWIDPKMLKDGWDGIPHWSIANKLEPDRRRVTPGPADYMTENVTAHLYRAPDYSFGLRTRNMFNTQSPGPAAYTLDPMFGARTIRAGKPQAPSYTAGVQLRNGSFFQDLANSPGPAMYSVGPVELTKHRPPAHNMHWKNYPPPDSATKPGPGQHDNHIVWVHKTRTPEFSFGIPHSRYSIPLILRADVCFD